MNAIVERLKEVQREVDTKYPDSAHPHKHICGEAASEIERLQGEVVRLRECADNLSFPVNITRAYGKPHPTRIPWHIADLAYSGYCQRYGKKQSLERIAERGGFYPEEMDEFLPDWIERVAQAVSYHEEREQLRIENDHLQSRLAEFEFDDTDGELSELESEIDFMLDEPEDADLDDGIDFVDEDSDSGELPPEVQAQLDWMKKMARDAGIEVEGDE